VLDHLVVSEHALLSLFLKVEFSFGEVNDALVASCELDGILRPGVEKCQDELLVVARVVFTLRKSDGNLGF